MQKQIKLGKTDLLVNPIGFGGIPIQRLTIEESDRVLKKAIDLGINFFDTSRIYTDSEEKMGRVFSKVPRNRIIIASKTFSRDEQNAAADIDKGLKLLKTDYYDLYQLHNIGTETDKQKAFGAEGAYEALKKAQKAGKIRYIGLTGHKPPFLLPLLKEYDFATIQIPLNYIEQAGYEELVPYAKTNGIGIIAMKPVAGGAFKNVPLVLRFILWKGADVVIPGIDAEHQIEENLSALTTNDPLTEKELSILEEEKKGMGENFCRRCEYCMPCPQGLPISFLHTLSAYYFRYNLKKWAIDRINSLPKSYKDCTGCGECVKKCPYNLNMPKIFKENLSKMSLN